MTPVRNRLRRFLLSGRPGSSRTGINLTPGRVEVPHRIVIFCHSLSATQEIHFLRPLRDAQAKNECQVVVVEEQDLKGVAESQLPRHVEEFWHLYSPTIAVFSRYAGCNYELLTGMARRMRTPIVAHLDDDLFDVPVAIGQAKSDFHGSPDRLASLNHVFRSADLIYLPTEPLASRIRERGFPAPIMVPSIQVAAGSDELQPPTEGGPTTIGYMGTASHQHDLQLVVPAIQELLEERSSLRFETFGTVGMPDVLTRFGGRVRNYPPEQDYDAFVRQLSSVRWHVGLAPLQPLKFNDFRTYTKWLEYTMAGIAVLASDSIVYRDVVGPSAGILVKDGEWLACLAEMIDKPEVRSSCVGAAQRKVVEELRPKRLADHLLSLSEPAR